MCFHTWLTFSIKRNALHIPVKSPTTARRKMIWKPKPFPLLPVGADFVYQHDNNSPPLQQHYIYTPLALLFCNLKRLPASYWQLVNKCHLSFAQPRMTILILQGCRITVLRARANSPYTFETEEGDFYVRCGKARVEKKSRENWPWRNQLSSFRGLSEAHQPSV